VADLDGRGISWTGEAELVYDPDLHSETNPEIRFHAILPVLTMLLQREGQVTYRTLMQVFGLDDALRNDLRKELAFRGLAIDKDGEGLVWIGETQATGTIELPDAISTDVSSAEPVDIPEPARSAPEAERRQLTVMFCDLADSTKLSQQLDPEDLREVVRAYQATAAEVIERYEGHMAQYLGDGLLIYFGWPVAHEDDAQRALHAGLGIVDAITTTLNLRLEREKGVRLTVRLGVHTGPVVVGEMGGGERMENLATGETVNIAARLEGLAAPNTVVISDVTERLVQRAFALEALGPQVLKGVAEPMQTFRVLAPLADDEDETPTVGIPFLVGRDEEVGLLLRRWEQAKVGLGQVVLVSGEAGIGKSSLLAMVRHQVVQAGYTRMTFRCSPYHTNSALYPVIEFVQRVLDLQAGDTPATRLDKLEGVLSGYSRPLEEVVPLYAALLSVPVPEERYAALNLSPQQQRQQTQDALVGWLLEEAERHPTLAMWEDLHWADPTTLEMLGLVLEQTPTVPMLHVLTFRPEFEPPWASRSHMTPVTLNRLELAQVEALITHMARGKALPPEVVEHIVGKTDGVPLYVEELTKMLLASGLLHEEANAYVLTGPLSTVTIPDTLQDSLMARLDQMNTAKEVAQLGAVLGREFSYEMLRAIASQDDTTLQARLAQLVEAELLYQRGRPPRATYIFKHALIQDAAYASLLRSTRQRVHQQIARVLKEQFAETVEVQPELLAYHYTEAELNEQAVGYWQRAGQRASDHSAHLEAISHCTTGIALLKTVPETPEHTQHALTLHIALGTALQNVKGQAAPEVEQAYTQARMLSQQVGETPELAPVLFGLWRFYNVQPRLHAARELGDTLLRLAQHTHDPGLAVIAHYALGATCFFLGAFPVARQHMEDGIARYTPDQRRAPVFRMGHDPGVGCRAVAALTLWLLGYPVQALALLHEALALAQELSHPASLVMVQCWAAYLLQWHRDVSAVYEHAEAAVALSTEQGFAQWAAQGTILRGWALARQGQGEEGLAQVRQGIAAYRATGARLNIPHYCTVLADVATHVGHPQDGLQALAEALAVMETTEVRFYAAELHRLKGACLLGQAVPDAAQAAACFRQALDIARRQEAKSWELRAATSLARLWQSQGKRQDAYDLLAPVYEWFTEGFDTADLQDARALLQELEA
jgi:predicted ATPase/class 3 adenylate cyclase